MLLLRQHELYKFQIHVLPLPPANFVHVTPGQWADHNGIKSFLMSYTITTNFTVGVFFCDSLDLCYDPCHVIKHES